MLNNGPPRPVLGYSTEQGQMPKPNRCLRMYPISSCLSSLFPLTIIISRKLPQFKIAAVVNQIVFTLAEEGKPTF
jgi:hypothetical protein